MISTMVSGRFGRFSIGKKRHRGPWDVVVIGAGLGGLATALLLAKMRQRVLVVERNRFVGGYASEVVYDNVGFDYGAQDITLLGKGGTSIAKELGLWRILQPVASHAVSVYPNHRFTWSSGRAKETKNYLLATFPEQADSLRRFFRDMKAFYKEIDKYLSVRGLQTQLRSFPLLARYHSFTAAQLLEEYFSDETLRSLLGTYGLFYQGMPIHALSALHFVGLLQSYFDTGAFYPKGGIQGVVETIQAELKKRDGEVVTGIGVEEIIVEDGKARGVALADGRVVHSRAVVANTDPRVVYGRLLPKTDIPEPPVYELKADHLSRCQLFGTLDEDAPQLPFVTFFTQTYDKKQEYDAFINGEPVAMRIFVPPPGAVRSFSIAIPAPYAPWAAAKEEGASAYEARRKRLMDHVAGMFAEVYPELPGKYRFVGMITPVDLKQHSGNGNGSLYGADATPAQSGQRGADVNSAVRGLFFTGQWVGGGSATLVMRSASLSAAKVDRYLRSE